MKDQDYSKFSPFAFGKSALITFPALNLCQQLWLLFQHVDINVCGRNEWKHLHGKKTFVLNIIWVVFLFGKFILDVSKSEYYHIMLSYSSILFFSDFDIYMFYLGIAILKKTNQIATWTDQYFRGVDIIFQRPQNITYLISNTHVFHLDNSDTFLPIMNIFTQHTLTIKAAGI